MLSDIYSGAFDAARRMRLQFADAQDAAQDAVLATMRAGRAIAHPSAYGAKIVLRQRRREPMSELPLILVDRSIDVSDLREALIRCGADRWYKVRKAEKDRIRARLAREGWGL